eukprot:gnl/TRDRNA2_/TRDRNA2_147427_c2_seq1.p1 gnl/TRDRNA2_/TRDRNA2_147427_c2~~gnl/TRDRNA2_/TRDRNA2_147427_c2_seq1.p1  ORF type:complete len:570 (+),score=135.08 gnl/TRDRNA2_/TRDRNA2_147427_c2_seq1:10-1719(+)
MRTGNVEEVARSLKGGADANQADDIGETPLFEAAALGNADIVATLLLHRADPGRESTARMIASDVAADAATKNLLKLFQGKELSAAKEQKAMEALGASTRQAVMEHLRVQPEPVKPASTESSTSEMAAPKANNRSTVKFDSPLLVPAIQGGNLQEVLRVLKSGADANATDDVGETPLFEAASTGDVDMVAALLLHGADPNHQSAATMIAADVAADVCTKSLLKLFSGKDCSPAVENKALEGLGDSMRQAVKQHLQARGRNGAETEVPTKQQPSSQEMDGGYPKGAASKKAAPREVTGGSLLLLPAVQNGNVEEVLRLLKDGADANVADEVGETPLFEAASLGNPDIVAALLLHAAEPSRKSSENMVPIDFAADVATNTLLKLYSGHEQPPAAIQKALESLTGSIRQEVAQDLRRRGHELPSSNSLEAQSAKLQARETAESATAEASKKVFNPHLLPAVQSGDLPEVLRLLKGGADANAFDDVGETPIFEAAAAGDANVLAALLLYSADPNQKSHENMFAIDVAADFATKALLKLFQGKEVSPAVRQKALDNLGPDMKDEVTQHLKAVGI